MAEFYTLSDMRDRVRRRVDAIRYTVHKTTGEETAGAAPVQLDPALSNQDIDMYLQSALTMRYAQIVVEDPNSYSDTTYIDIVTNQQEYRLPQDIFMLRALYWLRTDEDFGTRQPPQKMDMMKEEDAQQDLYEDLEPDAAPTYRRRMGYIVLNTVPLESWTGRIMVDYVKTAQPLVHADQALQFQYANILQEMIIIDASAGILEQRYKLDTQFLRGEAAQMQGTITQLIRNAHNYKSVELSPAGYMDSRRDEWRIRRIG